MSHGNKKNLVGQTFGILSPIVADGKDRHGNYMWLCRCECGGEKRVRTSSLLSGQTRSCGCKEGNRQFFNRTVKGRRVKHAAGYLSDAGDRQDV